VADGFDPEMVLAGAPKSTSFAASSLYYYKVKENAFVAITADVFAKVNAGKM
jgi:hypothetical protein